MEGGRKKYNNLLPLLLSLVISRMEEENTTTTMPLPMTIILETIVELESKLKQLLAAPAITDEHISCRN
eukprot:13819197-Ditylum_brightwellii.AAC.1